MSEEELRLALEKNTQAIVENTKATWQLYTTVFGTGGQGGCLSEHRADRKAFEEFKENDYRPFKLKVYAVMGASLAAGGGIGVAIGKAVFGG